MKARLTLIPWRPLQWLGELAAQGAAGKYKEQKWHTIPANDHIDAALRHIGTHLTGDMFDNESSQPHLIHAISRLIYATEVIHREKAWRAEPSTPPSSVPTSSFMTSSRKYVGCGQTKRGPSPQQNLPKQPRSSDESTGS